MVLEFIFQACECNSYRHIGILMINFRVYGNGLSAPKDYGINCFKEYLQRIARSPAKMVWRVSVPFPVLLLRHRGKAKYGTGRKKPLTSRRCTTLIRNFSFLWKKH
jgi:hypothetical protein